MDHAFVSLACIRILLLPVGNIQHASFETWAGEVKEFEEVKLSDVPADSRDDRARFMPNPLATGTLLLSFTGHPPPPSRCNLDLFRPSDFPLGIVGIASCSQSDVLSSIYSQFNGSVAELFPSHSIFPLAKNCFVFEEGDGNTNLNVGNHMPGLVVIPSMMGNKKLYIGTLLAELCSNILGEFSMMVKTLESPSGTEALNAGIFSRMPNYKITRASMDGHDTGRPSSVASPLHSLPENGSAARQVDPRVNMKRASTLGPGVTGSDTRTSHQTPPSKRQSTMGTSTPNHARLYKVLGDLFLLAGRTMDASIWYNEAVYVLKQPQDLAWQASALEGMAIAGVIDAWSMLYSPASVNAQATQPWSGLSEKLSRAVSLYSAAAEVADSEGRMPELAFLYVTACFRHSSLLYYIWFSNGLTPLAFGALLHGRLDTGSSRGNEFPDHLNLRAGLSRSVISEILAQAHGPWLLHLGSRERIDALRNLANMYSRLRYRRKEAYVLRELLASLMDLLVQGREESRGTSELSLVVPEESNSNPAAGYGNVGIREKYDVVGNASILRLVRYVCEVHGVDLDSVKFITTKDHNGAGQVRNSRTDSQQIKESALRQSTLEYAWPDLQIGLIRESLAVAEALPDYHAVVLFALSSLRDLYPLLDPEDQFHFHTAASRALATVRRRGDERKLEYWLAELVVNMRFVPLPFDKLPLVRPWSDIQTQSLGGEELVKTDPFVFNSRRLVANKRQAFAVANEIIELVVTLENPYSVALDILEVELSTSGVQFIGKPQAVVIQGNSLESVTLSGQATEAGVLIIRGCNVLLPGTERHETVLPIFTEDEEEKRFLNYIAILNEGERSKTPSLGDRLDKKRKHTSLASSQGGEKIVGPPKYLEVKIVPEQPCLRIRRTSLTNGAVMLYDGETSVIRLTVENVSTLPIDFLELTFEDSIRPYLEQTMNGDLDVFDMYETEYSLVRRPVFSWEPDKNRKDIPPGRESMILVKCFGRPGCTDGTVHVSYSYTHRHEDGTPPTVFYTRQLLYPVLVTVYQMLECSGMNLLPVSSLAASEDIKNEWETLLAHVDDAGWCFFALDVQNLYGLAFEVTLSYKSKVSTSRIIPPGSTYRIVLPIERFSLPTSATSDPIPSLTNRQFVVTGLPSEEDRAQRELFWYREELLSCIHASWKEATGSRTGELSLRQQRFTQPMLNALRMDDIRVTLTVSSLDIGGRSVKHNAFTKESFSAPPNVYVVVTAKVQNLTPSSLVLSISLNAEPSDYFTYDGVLKDIPLGRLKAQESKEHQATVMFVAQGQFNISAQVREVIVGQEGRSCGTGSVTVEARAS